MCSANSVRMFPQKQSNSDTHSLQVLQGVVHIHPPLAAHSLCLSAVMLLLPPTCSVEGPAHSYLTLPLPEKPTHPSPPLRHVHSVCASVCVCSCMCTCTCSTAYSFLCVFECLLVCTQGGRGGMVH